MAKTAKASQIAEQKLVESALDKQAKGNQPTTRELRALKRYEAERERELRLEYYETVPKRDYVALSGRDTKILHSQADRYELPLRSDTISLGAVLTAFHDLLAKHGHKIRAEKGSVEEVKLREAELRAQQRELRIKRELGELVDLEQIKTSLGVIAATMRRAGDRLGRRFGPDAQRIMNEAIEDGVRESERQFGE